MSTTLSPSPSVHTKSTSMPIDRLVGSMLFCLTASIAFFNLVTLNPDKIEVALDAQVAIKLTLTGFAGLVGLYGLIAIPAVRQIFCSLPGLWLTIISLCYLLASAVSITPGNSFASSGALICIVTFAVTAVVLIGNLAFLRAIMFGLGWFIAMSWVAYLMFPSIGVYVEPLLHGQEVVRMAGLSHPNTLGQYSALVIGLVMLLKRKKLLPGSIWWGILILAALALYFSMSRASTASLLVGSVYACRVHIWRWLGPIGTVAMALLSATLLALTIWQFDLIGGGGEELLSSLSKSGDAEEVTSITGRTHIWAYSVERISERPWLGFGPATSKEILTDYMSYTHNLWLNLAFSAGIFCGLAGLFLFGGRLVESIRRPNSIIDFLLMFLCVNGIVENVMFAYVPSAPTMLLVLIVVWHVLGNDDRTSGGAS